MNGNIFLNQIEQISLGLAFIIFPLLFIFAFAVHPGLLQPHVLNPKQIIQRARNNGLLQFGHVLVMLGTGLLIVVGLVLLAQNFGISTLNNWWALFILIPAVGALANAWRAYSAAGGHLTGSARGSLIGGLILLMVTAVFLFNLNWSLLGPILIILAGAGLLINTMLPG